MLKMLKLFFCFGKKRLAKYEFQKLFHILPELDYLLSPNLIEIKNICYGIIRHHHFAVRFYKVAFLLSSLIFFSSFETIPFSVTKLTGNLDIKSTLSGAGRVRGIFRTLSVAERKKISKHVQWTSDNNSKYFMCNHYCFWVIHLAVIHKNQGKVCI